MRVGEVLRVLGYQRGPLRREQGERVRRYRKVETVVPDGGDTPNTENPAPRSQPSLPSPPKATHTQGIQDEPNTNTEDANPCSAGGDGDAEDPEREAIRLEGGGPESPQGDRWSAT
jgi:hypothetical protein